LFFTAFWDLQEIGDLSLEPSLPLSPIPLLLLVNSLSLSLSYFEAVFIFDFLILIFYVCIEWRQVLVDLRNHGRSAEIESLEPPHDMVNAANDLANLVKARNWAWPDVVIGHSMGGKVALQFAESCARGDYGDSVSLPKQVSLHLFFLSLSLSIYIYIYI
jgi:pimeloyl-ACP methyl ester carboxylesterase